MTVIKNLNHLKSINPDIAFICNPSSKHVAFGIFCAKIGCDLFIEKPISNSLKNIDKLYGIVKKKKLVLNVGYQFLFHPLTKKLKKILKINNYGFLLRVEAVMNEYIKNYRKYGSHRDLLITKKLYGGGILLEQSHDISVLTWLIENKLQVKHCDIFRHKELGFQKNTEDTANLALTGEFKSKKILFMVYLSSLKRSKEKKITLFFSDAKIETDYVKNTLMIEKNKKKKTLKIKIDRNILFLNELKDFFKRVSKRNLKNPTFTNSILTLKTINDAKGVCNYV